MKYEESEFLHNNKIIKNSDTSCITDNHRARVTTKEATFPLLLPSMDLLEDAHSGKLNVQTHDNSS